MSKNKIEETDQITVLVTSEITPSYFGHHIFVLPLITVVKSINAYLMNYLLVKMLMLVLSVMNFKSWYCLFRTLIALYLQMFFEDNIDDAKYCGHLYGLGTSYVQNGGSYDVFVGSNSHGTPVSSEDSGTTVTSS